jgi:hypothetical protein
MVTFYSSLDLSSQNCWLWKAAEDYCWVGQQRYHVLSLEDEKMHLDRGQESPHWLTTTLKVASYALIIPLVVALVVRAYYRHLHTERIWKEPSIEEMIARLYEAQKKGLKLALFVGREAEQSIPDETGWVWCSLNSAKLQRPLGKDRLHLPIDFNTTDIQKIHGLFNKVVVDYSTLKFFDGAPWLALKKTLAQKPESELVTEDSPMKIAIASQKKFDGVFGKASWPLLEWAQWREKGLPQLIAAQRKHLEVHFGQVEYLEGDYPYRDSWEKINCNYWRLQNPLAKK